MSWIITQGLKSALLITKGFFNRSQITIKEPLYGVILDNDLFGSIEYDDYNIVVLDNDLEGVFI